MLIKNAMARGETLLLEPPARDPELVEAHIAETKKIARELDHYLRSPQSRMSDGLYVKADQMKKALDESSFVHQTLLQAVLAEEPLEEMSDSPIAMAQLNFKDTCEELAIRVAKETVAMQAMDRRVHGQMQFEEHIAPFLPEPQSFDDPELAHLPNRLFASRLEELIALPPQKLAEVKNIRDLPGMYGPDPTPTSGADPDPHDQSPEDGVKEHGGNYPKAEESRDEQLADQNNKERKFRNIPTTEPGSSRSPGRSNSKQGSRRKTALSIGDKVSVGTDLMGGSRVFGEVVEEITPEQREAKGFSPGPEMLYNVRWDDSEEGVEDFKPGMVDEGYEAEELDVMGDPRQAKKRHASRIIIANPPEELRQYGIEPDSVRDIVQDVSEVTDEEGVNTYWVEHGEDLIGFEEADVQPLYTDDDLGGLSDFEAASPGMEVRQPVAAGRRKQAVEDKSGIEPPTDTKNVPEGGKPFEERIRGEQTKNQKRPTGPNRRRQGKDVPGYSTDPKKLTSGTYRKIHADLKRAGYDIDLRELPELVRTVLVEDRQMHRGH